MVKADGPTAGGVPESTPLALRVRPSGKVPLVSANVYGAVPPVAVKIWLYGVPITGVVSEDGEITIETDAVAVPLTAMGCVTELLFRLLSVSTNDPASEPVVRGIVRADRQQSEQQLSHANHRGEWHRNCIGLDCYLTVFADYPRDWHAIQPDFYRDRRHSSIHVRTYERNFTAGSYS